MLSGHPQAAHRSPGRLDQRDPDAHFRGDLGASLQAAPTNRICREDRFLPAPTQLYVSLRKAVIGGHLVENASPDIEIESDHSCACRFSRGCLGENPPLGPGTKGKYGYGHRNQERSGGQAELDRSVSLLPQGKTSKAAEADRLTEKSGEIGVHESKTPEPVAVAV